jgi:hypothetical protein
LGFADSLQQIFGLIVDKWFNVVLEVEDLAEEDGVTTYALVEQSVVSIAHVEGALAAIVFAVEVLDKLKLVELVVYANGDTFDFSLAGISFKG